ncbi:glycoside hydrolase family 36 protein [Spirosoma areae]
MKKSLLFIFVQLAILPSLFAQPFAKWTKTELTLDNGLVKRIVQLPYTEKNEIQTNSFELSGVVKGFVRPVNDEFLFASDGVELTGKSGWNLIDVKESSDLNQGNGATISLKGITPENSNLELSISYLLYPESPVIRKRIGFRNLGKADLKIESLEIEKLTTNLDMTYAWIYNNYGRYKTMNGYVGNYYDPAVVLHEVTGNRGLVLGNEVPGVMKRTSALLDGKSIGIGFNPFNADYPLRKWLKPGETWESSFVFVAPYQNAANPDLVLNTVVPDFVRKYMGTRLSEMKNVPTAVYNTWAPFRGDMTTASVIDVAKNAAQCGFSHFVMDAGWNTIDGKPTLTGDKDIDWILNLGDWKEDREKFPNGLKEVFNEVKALGMKPGLWISVATATKNSKVYREHPDWFVQDEKGNPAYLHDESGNPNQVTACLGGGYYDYIKESVLRLVKAHDLKYVKLDLSVVTSAYRFNPKNTGCCAKNHAYHRDREESYQAIYERCFQLFDELHAEVPDLYIDCTFETLGKLQLIDFAMLQHADGNWLTNIDEKSPKGSWRVRQMGWWRSPVITASSMVIGNLILDEPNFYLSLLSNSGTMPILLGDTRKLTEADKKQVRQWADWMKATNERHQFMLFRQDLAGFGEPAEGSWDGFQRINTDTKKGGIIGVFRQGANESKRTVTINYLDPLKKYRVTDMTGNVLATMTGRALKTTGFPVTLTGTYAGALFEITAL